MRLLLCLAVVQLPLLSIAWSIPFFSSRNDDGIYLYPGSPAEADPESIRVKRQAYQVYVGGDVSVTVDKSGQAETGAWGPWTSDQECSRTCGGGVQIEKRQCNGECSGPSVRYVSCNVERCPPGSKDFRAEQCSAKDDTPLDGNYYKWLPYPGKNKCELTCKPDNANFYYKWADKVIDGTTCDSNKDNICVEGVCLPVGCDKKLGSALKDDKCGVCGGDGSKCKTVEGFFDERNLSPGYHNIIRLPVGATSIRVEEMRPTTNSLAIKNMSDYYYLNGNYQIQVIDKDLEIGGTIFEYDNHKSRGGGVAFEKLIAKGPINEELTIALLFQTGNKDSAIKYEFSVPLEQDMPFMYKPGEWSSCSVTCGKGVQTRTPFCVETATGSRVADEVCDEANSTKPETEKDCETIDCEPEWFQGEWEPCSETCGNAGSQYRVVYCHSVFANGKRITVDDSNCTLERPPVRQSCNRFSCPEWQAGPWSACSEKCGDAFQYRSVTCRSEKEGEEGKLLPAEACGELTIDDKRSCNLGPCEGLMFSTSDWNLCQKCNDTEETRNVTCKDRTGRLYPLEKCLNENTTEIPIDIRSCATPPPCVYEWHSSEWSKCSTECGHGHQSRRVLCAIHELGDLNVVDESHCNANSKPSATMNCTNEEKCNGTYYTGPWSTCTAECGGGSQTRMIVCLNYDKKPVPEWCDEAVKPPEEQECNTHDCPTCEDSEFGCCPDNSTFATGAYLQGCSNCSISEFGCCVDNVTEATGADGQGCPEYVGAEEASGEDMKEKEEEDMCEVKSEETGEVASVECKVANVTLEAEELLDNVTAENITVHCSKTEFGCCPDWTSPAEGKDNKGCPVFVQGACNETANGCCPDEVTMARGPNFEGCGEPSCAASLYGCCKDRKTIAFGPHYAGCERSSFPCELSTFGCCPDGETAALGVNGKGCGAECIVSKYGCCPDGITPSKGTNNEGCGCAYAQFGCCPDGKSAAKGPGYYGCPESCAQSQYGCCPDGKTISRGPNKEGCPCQYTRYGCCADGETAAMGPHSEGCDECRYAKYGCCPDGETRAVGPNFAGCPSTTVAPYLLGGTVAPEKISSCSLPQDQGTVCHPGYKLVWFYDTAEGRCSQFWYGGCEGNDNRFATKEQCETICVEPPARGRCYLPKMEGPVRCTQLSARYWYDYTTRQCGAFWWRGCLGNANNFESWEECQTFCAGIGPVERKTTTEEPSPVPVYFDASTAAPAPQAQPQPVRHDPELEHQYPRQQYHPQSMEEICRMTVDSGPCANYEDMFYYDSFSGKCHPFIYGGCGGNLNKYRTREECEARCSRFGADRNEDLMPTPDRRYGGAGPLEPVKVAPIPVDQAPRAQRPLAPPIAEPPSSPSRGPPKSRDACNERMDVGRCQGSFESYYYEKATGTCEQFHYSGCGGTANRFHSKQQCEELCMRPAFVPPRFGHAAAGRVSYPPMPINELPDVEQEQQQQPVHQCEQPKETGPCDRFVTKWYYNIADGTCNRFHYGGCEGTANRFDSENQCKAACGDYADACTLPKVAGPCSGKHQRFYFDQETRRCERFEFGGCLGNSNNFVHLADCEQRCAAPSAMESLRLRSTRRQSRCNLPKEVGMCRASIEQYYFDVRSGQCELFIYGGCGGNENRFETIEDCRRTCDVYGNTQTNEMRNEIDGDEDDDYKESNESAQDDDYEV
uniref:Papilin n=1 Tax=Parascaris univalens TaxID=6257 RepID=A0A915C8V4_PARUN